MATTVVVLCVETSFAGSQMEMLSRPFLTLPIKLVHAPWDELMVDSRIDTLELLYQSLWLIWFILLDHNRATFPELCPIRQLLDLLHGSSLIDPRPASGGFLLLHCLFRSFASCYRIFSFGNLPGETKENQDTSSEFSQFWSRNSNTSSPDYEASSDCSDLRFDCCDWLWPFCLPTASFHCIMRKQMAVWNPTLLSVTPSL
jgi:hypothetical protein